MAAKEERVAAEKIQGIARGRNARRSKAQVPPPRSCLPFVDSRRESPPDSCTLRGSTRRSLVQMQPKQPEQTKLASETVTVDSKIADLAAAEGVQGSGGGGGGGGLVPADARLAWSSEWYRATKATLVTLGLQVKDHHLPKKGGVILGWASL